MREAAEKLHRMMEAAKEMLFADDDDASNSKDDGVDVEASISIKVMSRHRCSYVWTQVTPKGAT